MPSSIVPTPVLGADRRWYQVAGHHPMREAHGVARDAIFRDFFQKLERAPSRTGDSVILNARPDRGPPARRKPTDFGLLARGPPARPARADFPQAA